MTLGEGHKSWHDVKGLATKYLRAKFHDCIGRSVCQNVNVEFFKIFPSAPGAVTLSEGHTDR